MAKYKSVQVEVPEITSLGLDPSATAELDAYCHAYRLVQDTPIDFRGILPPAVAGLFNDKLLPPDKTKEKIKEELDKVIGRLPQLPERVLGSTWDLRRTDRATRKINEDRLKMTLLALPGGFAFDVDCPPSVIQEVVNLAHGNTGPADLIAVVCPHCQGTSRRRLTGLEAVNALVAAVTDESTSSSWSVYKLAETKGA